jgi:hypothetical protein
MKLIKLNEEDYINVDDLVTDVKDLDVWVYDDDYDEPLIYKTDEDFFKAGKSAWRITYSTKPLEDVIIANKYEGKGWINIKPLSFSEIEELLFGYSVEKMAKNKWSELIANLKLDTLHEGMWCGGYQHGFNAHKELVKARFLSTQLYSNENHLEWIYNRLIEVHGENSNYDYMIEFKKIIQSLQPTEWDVEFINGKLTLKQ